MVHYKGFSPEESAHIHHTFNNGSFDEVDALIKGLGGRKLERVPGHGYTGKLYHGTADDSVAANGSVSAARSLGKKSVHPAPAGAKQKAEDHAHGTERESTAWEYAQTAGQAAGKRGYVVELEHNDQMGMGDRHDTNQEWISPQFKVKERLDTKPGRQGTIPTENWNKYRDPNSDDSHRDANHPEMDELHGREKVEHSPDVPSSIHSDQLSLFDGANASRAEAHGYQQMKQ